MIHDTNDTTLHKSDLLAAAFHGVGTHWITELIGIEAPASGRSRRSGEATVFFFWYVHTEDIFFVFEFIWFIYLSKI